MMGARRLRLTLFGSLVLLAGGCSGGVGLVSEGSEGGAHSSSLVDSFVLGSCGILVPSGVQESGDSKDGYLFASIMVGEVLWQMEASCIDDPEIAPWEPLHAPGPVEVLGDVESWDALSGALEAGRRVLVGVGQMDDGSYDLSFLLAVDGTPSFLGSGFESWTSQLRGFLTWEGNPLRGEAERLAVAWAEEEAESAEEGGEIAEAFSRYVDEVLFPREPTWDELAPDDRAMDDAPQEILDGLDIVSAYAQVPPSWHALGPDALICLDISLGSNGCNGVQNVERNGYLYLCDCYVVPGEPMTVELGSLAAGGWGSRPFGLLPAEALSESVVFELPGDPATLASTDPSRLPVLRYRNISWQEELELIPEAEPVASG